MFDRINSIGKERYLREWNKIKGRMLMSLVKFKRVNEKYIRSGWRDRVCE